MVTGTFAHEPSDELLNVRIEGEPEPIGCTPNHPFWSETREDYVQAIELEPGEEVWTAIFGVVPVESVTVRPESDRVYNLEVQGEHVYQVGESGVLVHNGTTTVYLGSIPAKKWYRIFGKPKAQTGSYTVKFKNGMKYHGKGPRSRARQSAREHANKHKTSFDDHDIDWEPAANDTQAFMDEATRIRGDGGVGPAHGNLNQINSPGEKLLPKLPN